MKRNYTRTEEGMTPVKEIAEKEGISIPRVNQIIATAKKKLLKNNGELLKEYYRDMDS